jgi:uncharacterized protein (DUF1800 family)
METFARRQRFITLHQPLEKLATRDVTRPQTLPLCSDLQERGSEMIGTIRSSGARFAGAMVLSVVVLVWSGCGGGTVGSSSSGSTSNGMTITPPSATIRGGDSTQFSASVTGNTNQAVAWWVNGVSSGNATVGTIDQTGKYHAPLNLPSPASVTIKATSVADKSLSATSTVSLQNAIPILQALSPTFLPVGNFSITVGGANFVKGSKVLFGSTALTTTYVGPTQLTATGTATQAQVGMVKIMVENPDPGKSDSAASMNVQVGAAGQVSVQVIPPSAQITAGSTFQYRSAVNGAGGNTAVKWSINGILSGNATVGTISAGGIYTAPATVPTPNTIQVTATSLADTTASASGTATLTNPAPIVNSVLPTTIAVGNFTLVVTGQKFAPGAVVSFGGTFLPTTFVSSTEVTATGTATSAQAGTIQVTVINPDPGSMTSNAFALQVGSSSNSLSAAAAGRLLEQSTWGVNPQSLSHVQAVGMQGFLNEQFAAPASTFPAPAADDDMSVVQKRFFTNALTGQDQLRQRVAWGLSQIFVASAEKINNPSAFVLWQNMFQTDAFGNFSTLLTDVTLSPVMGNYLDMVNNDKPGNGVDPNENFAREILQLFSIGLEQMNPDGTLQVDGSGNPVPTYGQDEIIGFAHVFTGWTYPTKPGATAKFRNPEFYGGPMIAFDTHHDTGAKLLLNGVTLPAGGTTTGDLAAALQNIFNHPNVGPFITKQLIKRLVTSNPSPDYVGRVAAVFADNGSGVRGDLKAVVTAILMDPEARRGDDPAQAQPSDGKLKEPVLFITNLLRSMNAVSDGSVLSDRADDMKQPPFFSPTVFNFYHPDHVIDGTTLVGPEFEIFDTSTDIARINFVNTLVYGSVSGTTTVDLSGYVPLAANPDQLVTAVAAVMMHGQVSDNMRSTLVTTITGIPDNTRRTKAAFYLIGSSSQFQVEH